MNRFERIQARGAALRQYLVRNKRVVAPTAIGVLLVVNLAVALLLGPFGATGATRPVNLDDTDSPSLGPVDGGGLSNLEELYVFGTDPQKVDTSGDGIPDWWKIQHMRWDPVLKRYTPDPLRSDAHEDPDGDGLTNVAEFEAGTNPNLWDTSGDGFPDGWLVKHGLDPLVRHSHDADYDEDGLTNWEEYLLGTNPLAADTSNNGITDFDAVNVYNTDPSKFSTLETGISDGWLVHWGLDPLDPRVPYKDLSGDGMTVFDEYRWCERRLDFRNSTEPMADYARCLDPTKRDSDGDGMADAWEIRHGLDPLEPADGGWASPQILERLAPTVHGQELSKPEHERRVRIANATTDPDDDGLTNYEEYLAGSNPFRVDTDGDGLPDADEVVGWEIVVNGERRRVYSNPGRADTSGDGITDKEKFDGSFIRNGIRRDFCPDGPCALDPSTPDTALAGLSDLEQILYPVTPRLNPTLADTSGSGLTDGEEHKYWTMRARTINDGASAGVRDALVLWRDDQARKAPTNECWKTTLEEALLPTGDLDCDGEPNIVDPDSDGDGLTDGDELNPGRWPAFPGSDQTFPGVATDPALPDTSGDTLPDSWKRQFTHWDYDCGSWNLNPAKKNSFENCFKDEGLTDCERELDGSGVRYRGAGYLQPREFVFSSCRQFEAGTDPNNPDTDGDGIPDGWEHYFAMLGRQLGRINPLNPLDPTSAGKVSKTMTYVRLVPHFPGTPVPQPRDNETLVPPVFSGVPNPALGTLDVYRFEGTFSLTYLDEYRLRTDPAVEDTDGDGIPDAWEALYYFETEGDPAFNPTNAAGAIFDYAGGGLALYEEYLAGTNPLVPDSDFGGIPDGDEVNGGSDPLNPSDDDPFGDYDGDGLTNFEEIRQFGTDPTNFDTDRDGLLDGPDVFLRDVHVVGSRDHRLLQEFQKRSIVGQFLGNNQWVFFGEMDDQKRPITDPLVSDTSNDGMPDGWERYYNLHPTRPTGALDSDTDGLTDLQEYTMGRPASWIEDAYGPWWFGSNPRNADTTGNGRMDGFIAADGSRIGTDFDYDGDGLNDFIGEDPYPFYDHYNTGEKDTRDPAFVRSWVFNEGRRLTNTLSDNAFGVPNFADRVEIRIVDVKVDFPHENLALYKGEVATLTGRVVLDHRPSEGVPGITVMTNLDRENGNAEHVLGTAISGADGRFTVTLDLKRERSYTVPEDVSSSVVFGDYRAAGDLVSWTLETKNLRPGVNKRLVVWTYGVAATEDRYSFPDSPCRGYCSGIFTARGVKGTYDTPFVLPDPLSLKTATQFDVPARIDTQNAGSVNLRGFLRDAAGDPVPSARVTMTWQGGDVTADTDADGGFPIAFSVGTFETPRMESIQFAYAGSPSGRVWDRTQRTSSVAVAFPTTLTGDVDEATNPRRVAVAGGDLVVRVELLDYLGRPIANENVTARFMGTQSVGLTDATGRARITITVPGSANVGNQPISLSYAGENPLYAPSEFDAGFVLINQRATLILRPVSDPAVEALLARVPGFEASDAVTPHILTKDLVLTGRLLDQGGSAARDQTERDALMVTVTAPGFTETVRADNATGSFRVTIPKERLLGVGFYTIGASFGGSTFYSPAVTEALVLLTTTSEVKVAPKSLVRGGTVQIDGSLVNAIGRGVGNAVVDVYFRDTLVASPRTTSAGHFVAGFPLGSDEALGNARVLFVYNGTQDASILPSTPLEVSYRVLSATRIEIPFRTASMGVLTLNGTLLDDKGRPVAGERVRLSFDGKPAGESSTDINGVFEVLYDPGVLPAREYPIRATFPGSLLYAQTQNTGAIRLLSTSRIVVDDVSEAVRTKQFSMNGTLVSGTDAPVGGGVLEFTLLPNGSLTRSISFGRTTTDPQTGVFNHTFSVPRDIPLGTYPLRVTFRGDLSHVGHEILVPVQVVSFTQIVVEIPTRLKAGETFTARVTLINDQGEPVPNAIVYVHFAGYRFPFTLQTGEDGSATFPGRVLEPGSSEVRFAFAGDSSLLSAQDTRAIRIQGGGLIADEARTWTYIAVAVALLILLSAGALYWWRRSQVEEARQILADAEAGLLAGNEYIATILAAYKRLLSHFVKYGYSATPSLTAQEFAAAAKAALPVREGPLDELVTLFEEARYSDHAIGPRERDRALRALTSINRDLATNETTRRTPPPNITEESS